MKKNEIIICWGVFVLSVFTGCIRDGAPGKNCTAGVELSFVFADDVEGPGLYREIQYSRAPTESNPSYAVRYIVEIRDEDDVVLKRSIYAARFGDNGVTLKMTLPTNKDYHVKAWVDHVMAGDPADLFYDTSGKRA